MSIQMICGYTYYNGLISSKDGTVTMTETIEARLVGLGVAESVDSEGGAKSLNTPAPDKAEKTDLPDLSDKPDTKEETKAAPDEEPEGETDLSAMTFNELKELAENMGIDTKGMRSKAAVIEAIEAADKPPDPQVIE